MKRLMWVILVSISILTVAFLLRIVGDRTNEVLSTSSGIDKVKIAVCPTFVSYLDGLDKTIFITVSTSSTGESIELLNKGEVDFVLSGRVLRPDEPRYNSTFLGHGFSFLSNREITLKTSDLSEATIFTDLDVSEINQYFETCNISQVEDVYKYTDKGIVITSWENTNYTRANILHVINEDGSRNINSRIPILYYKENSNKELVYLISESVLKYAK